MRQKTKTLVVIPASGGAEYTSLAVESVRRNTDDALIVVVETDSSAQWKETADLRVVRPVRFKSFSDSVNCGLEVAREVSAEYAVVLNNDTVVGRGWLPPLLAALDEGYCVAGPMTNSCGHGAQVAHPPFECTAPQDMDHALVDKFAAALTHKRIPAFAVVGMCMAFRVDLLDRIGEFDRRFLVGNFEDNDWCLRATERNSKGCCVCAESFVWHFGSATFRKSGQFGEAMEANRIRFERKWLGKGGTPRRYHSSMWRVDRIPVNLTPEDAPCMQEVRDEMGRRGIVVRPGGAEVHIGLSVPDPGGDDFHEFCDAVELSAVQTSAASKSAEKPDISVCMIVKNEAPVLGRCLDSILPLARQLIVVDTGSTDATVAIAKQRGAEVYHYRSDGAFDFSSARNYSLGKAKRKWIFVMDADECLLPADVDSIRDTVESGRDAAYMIATRLYYDNPKIEGLVPNDGTHPDTGGYCGFVLSTKARLWLRSHGLCFRNEVHETVEQSAMEARVPLQACDAIVHHFGGRCLEEKDEFYADLGYEKIRTDPCQRTYRELGLQLHRMDKLDESVGILFKAMEFGPDVECIVLLADSFAKLAKRVGGGDDELKKAESYYLDALKADRDSGLANRHYATFLNQHGRYKEAHWHYRKISAAATAVGDAKTLCEFAFVCQNLDQPEEAVGLLEAAAKANREYVIGTGLLECAYQRTGIKAGMSGDMAKAVEMFKKALDIRPDFPEARHNLEIAEKYSAADASPAR